jgi:hypothetical protein
MGGRESAEIIGIHTAEVALGGNVEADGFGDFRAKVRREPVAGKVFVPGIDTAIGNVPGKMVDHVADVMQESGGDERRSCAGPLRRQRGLEAVREHRDGLA